jgi:hypothetical protein
VCCKLCGVTKRALIELFSNLRAGAKLVGLYINENKTNNMHIRRTDWRNIFLDINNFPSEKVCNFTFVGSVLKESKLCNLKFLEGFAKETERTMQMQNY